MKRSLLKRLQTLDSTLISKTRKSIALIDVTDFYRADRGGNCWILVRHGFEPERPVAQYPGNSHQRAP